MSLASGGLGGRGSTDVKEVALCFLHVLRVQMTLQMVLQGKELYLDILLFSLIPLLL